MNLWKLIGPMLVSAVKSGMLSPIPNLDFPIIADYDRQVWMAHCWRLLPSNR